MTLKVGDQVPNFTAIDTKGNTFDSSTYIRRKALVIYFYPKDDTPGCTTQACTFRDQYEDFKELGAEIIGISSDTVVSHQKFVKKYQLPFILLSDGNKKIRKLFGVSNDFLGLIPGRETFVVDKKGSIIFMFNSISAKSHIKRALEILRKVT